MIERKISPKFLTINKDNPLGLLTGLICRISDYFPKHISCAFICYKILSSILQGPQSGEILLFIKLQKPATHQKNERHWRSACRAAGIDLLA